MKDYSAAIQTLMLATNKIDGVYYYFARQMGLKENELAFLYALHDGKPHTQKEISEVWIIPKTTLNTVVKECFAKGYIRFGQERGKEKTLYLTDRGESYADGVLGRIREAENRAMAAALEKFSPEFADAADYFADCLHREFAEMKEALSAEKRPAAGGKERKGKSLGRKGEKDGL